MELAIIIPAFRKRFLRQSLQSLANQTNKNFNLYIGDDGSPENLREIVDEFTSTLSIKYTRFDNNIGAKNLVNQWTRCVDLIKDERWFWLFSDDDLADKNCVEEFYQTIKNDNEYFDVYRFNTRVIDLDNNIIGENQSPFIEDAFDMTIQILLMKRGHCMPDHIFRKRKYDEIGFVFSNFAQASDWATSINFASEKGICSIKNGKISWRYGENISSKAYINNHEKVIGHLQSLNWILNHFKNKIKNENLLLLKQCMYKNCIDVINKHYRGINIQSLFAVYTFLKKLSNNRKQVLKDSISLLRTAKQFKAFIIRLK